MDWSLKPCTATYTTVWDVQNHNDRKSLVDRLTCLPDELLNQILSLLPAKDAAATSVLSRRLRRVFSLITCLDFNVSPISLCLQHPNAIQRFPTFVSFVDDVLQAHQSRYLTKFRLKVSSGDFDKVFFDGCYFGKCKQGCLPDLKSARLNAWISYPLTLCGLRELDLCILVSEPGDSQLPPAIFTCETLEVLKLEFNIGLDHVYNMPSYRLPNLKLLLLFASFISVDRFLPRLVSSCPVLEDLTFKAFTNYVYITDIRSTSLRRMCLSMPKCDAFDEHNTDLVIIDTPSLEYLDYRDNLAMCYYIRVMHCLVEAVLVVTQCLEFGESFPQMIGLIRPFSYVQRLSLQGLILWELDSVDEKVLKDQLPVFPNLKHLELNVAARNNYWNKLLLPFLNCSPVLEVLDFSEGFTKDYDARFVSSNKEELELEREFYSTDHEVPLCCRFHLRKILVRKYYGLEREVGMIQFLLRHAIVLEELVICLAGDPIPDQMLVENTLKNLPKASLTCSIQVLC
ncbi:F-box/LRR-repeat protein At4g14103-like [Chenopodium quinoa]|uniref:F-box domain-containing protein n=1 Tax=Chenopodium quinoa TaxID=63459 RepID=A0A803LN03_CHEQI|nr:F-box/LRR-repeat protein At4g14103-like [Chenopodium quinoa]